MLMLKLGDLHRLNSIETLDLEETEIDDDEESIESDSLSVYDILEEWEESSKKKTWNACKF